jgi:ABC-2 type transport system permease protein
LRGTLVIAAREMAAALASPGTYAVAAISLFLFGLFFALDLQGRRQADLQGLFQASWLYVFLTPPLTMRLLAEEQKLGTIELLLTAPVRDLEVVLGKFLGSLGVLAAILAPTLGYVALVSAFGDPEMWPVVTGYLGLLLLGGACLSLGLLTSALTSSQVVAAVSSFALLLALWLSPLFNQLFPGELGRFFTYLSLPDHYREFAFGVLDASDVLYYVSLVAVALFLTARILEIRRWR